MATRKAKLPLDMAAHNALKALYVENRIALDQYKRCPAELQDLVDAFNNLTSRSDAPQDILHYMRTCRKACKDKPREWPQLGPQARKVGQTYSALSSSDELKFVIDCYLRLASVYHVALDSFEHDVDLAMQLSHEFSQEVGRVVPGYELLAILEAERKAGRLPRADLGDRGPDAGFGDLDEAAGL